MARRVGKREGVWDRFQTVCGRGAGGTHPGVRSTCSSQRKQSVARLLFEAAPNSSLVDYETTAERMERVMEREREREREGERERGFSMEDKLPLKCIQDGFFSRLY